MNLHQISDKNFFIQEVAHYISDNFANNFARCLILMPSGSLCNALREEIVSQIGNTELPEIATINDIEIPERAAFSSENTRFFKTISPLVEKKLFAEAIMDYWRGDYTISQSLALSPQISNLFFEFELNQINIEDLKTVPILDQPEHWNKTFDFLYFIHSKWRQYLAETNQCSQAEYRNFILKAQLQKLEYEPDFNLVISGISPSNKLLADFFSSSATYDNCHIILPAVSVFDALVLENDFHPVRLILDSLGELTSSLKLKYRAKQEGVNLASPTPFKNNSSSSHIIIETEDVFQEGQAIANLCSKHLQENKQKKFNIAIIINDLDCKEAYINSLENNGLVFNDSIGRKIIETNAISFLFAIADFIFKEFDIHLFVTLINHPYLNSIFSNKIDIILSKNRFIQNHEELTAILQSSLDQETINWLQNITSIRTETKDDNNFHSKLLRLVYCAEKLYPSIWQENISYQLSEAIAKILDIKWFFPLKDPEDFNIILRNLLSQIQVFEPRKVDAQIILYNMEDAALSSFDLVIITNNNQGYLPKQKPANPWINKYIQEKIGLNLDKKREALELYNFYLLMQNKNVVLTRAKNLASRKNILASNFLLRFLEIMPIRLQKAIYASSEASVIDNTNAHCSDYVVSTYFPSVISATDIELLVRSPYNFYAKKILKLKPKDPIKDEINFSDFGIIFHDIADRYSKLGKNNLHDFLLIAEELISSSHYPLFIKRQWMSKIKALAVEFTQFHSDRINSAQNIKIYTEIKGQMQLELTDAPPVIISAIADRIEICSSGKAYILDYKTGTIPSKQDVLSGLSPQLIVESIILANNGFKEIGPVFAKSLIYVKISSSSPYINITEIPISEEIIKSHQQGLTDLLSYYSKHKKFHIKQCLTTYDNYSYLARR